MLIKSFYVVFLGIVVAMFVGVGIAAFYPAPKAPECDNTVRFTPANDEAGKTLIETQKQCDEANKQYQNQFKHYSRNVSIIALLAALVILAASLMFAHRLAVLADGLLLGGILTLLYSIIRSFMSGDDRVRFASVAIALIVAVILGYFKFLRGEQPKHT